MKDINTFRSSSARADVPTPSAFTDGSGRMSTGEPTDSSIDRQRQTMTAPNDGYRLPGSTTVRTFDKNGIPSISMKTPSRLKDRGGM